VIFADQHQQRAASRYLSIFPSSSTWANKRLVLASGCGSQAKHVYGAAEWIPLGCERIFVRPTILLGGRDGVGDVLSALSAARSRRFSCGGKHGRSARWCVFDQENPVMRSVEIIRGHGKELRDGWVNHVDFEPLHGLVASHESCTTP
jgi:hypothetical protein